MITLPEVPALLLEGSPVYVDRRGTLQRATYLGQDGEHRFCAAKDRGMFILGEEPLRLDLTDATGRAHAAWWLARKAGLDASHGTIFRCRGNKSWTLHGSIGGQHFTVYEGRKGSRKPDGTYVAGLLNLDPNDPRLLEDGSRWVDAEALRLVCLHVAGVKS